LVDGAIRGSLATLSMNEVLIVVATIAIAIFMGLESGIAAGWLFSFALFVREAARAAPVRLTADAGLSSSHVLWGLRGQPLVSRIRGAIRIAYFQGVLYVAATQVEIQEMEQTILTDEGITFLVLDFSATSSMDDSSALVFKLFMEACKKNGLYVVFCGVNTVVYDKLQRAKTFSEADTGVLRAGDIFEVAMKTSRFVAVDAFLIASGDCALEFCELCLALRCMEVGPELLPQPSPTLVEFGELIRGDFAELVKIVEAGTQFEPRDCCAFVLLEGTLEASVEINNTQTRRAHQETVAVLRCIPDLEHDYVFSGCTQGTMTAVVDSSVLILSPADISELHRTGARKMEVLWTLLAEFNSRSMGPIALKAALQDVSGKFSSSTSNLMENALLDFEDENGRRPRRPGTVDVTKAGAESADDDSRQILRALLRGDTEDGDLTAWAPTLEAGWSWSPVFDRLSRRPSVKRFSQREEATLPENAANGQLQFGRSPSQDNSHGRLFESSRGRSASYGRLQRMSSRSNYGKLDESDEGDDSLEKRRSERTQPDPRRSSPRGVLAAAKSHISSKAASLYGPARQQAVAATASPERKDAEVSFAPAPRAMSPPMASANRRPLRTRTAPEPQAVVDFPEVLGKTTTDDSGSDVDSMAGSIKASKSMNGVPPLNMDQAASLGSDESPDSEAPLFSTRSGASSAVPRVGTQSGSDSAPAKNHKRRKPRENALGRGTPSDAPPDFLTGEPDA